MGTMDIITIDGYNFMVTELGTLEYIPFEWGDVEYRV